MKMTKPQHPLTPPLELLKQWEDDWHEEREHADVLLVNAYAAGALAGADAELEACCRDLAEYCDCGVELTSGRVRELLMELRRPKPPSLKEQALEALDRMDQFPTNKDMQIIRRALEQLQQPEEEQ